MTPFVFANPYRYGEAHAVAVEQVHGVYICLEYQVGLAHVDAFLADETEFVSKRYYIEASKDAGEFLNGLKAKALRTGATPEAIRFLGAMVPLSKKELAAMAAAKLSRKEELKNAAPSVKGAKGKTEPKAAPAKKGNAEALAKARAARTPAANRKYKVLVKAKDIKAREGSWTRAMVDHIVGHTNTEEATAALKADKEFGDRRLDFKWAADKGYIAFA